MTGVQTCALPILTYGSLISDDEITGALTRALGEHVGAYQIQQGTLAANNYTLTFVPAQLTVTAAPLTITADAQSKVYRQDDPALTHQIISGQLLSGDLITGTLTRITGENVGAYQIQQGTLTAGNNYTLSYVSANLSITKAPLEITADAKTKVYGQNDPAFTHQVTSGQLASGDSITGALSRITGEITGTYEIQHGTLTAGSNYNLTFVSAYMSINKAPLTIAADAKEKTYGQADPVLTYQITTGSLIEGDSITGALIRAAGEDVGTYEIQQGALTAGNNYALTFIPANLSITKAPLLIKADDIGKSYDAPDPELTVSYTGFKFADTESVVSGLSVDRETGEEVGAYIITPTSATADNYHISYATGTLTIDKAALTITANPQSKVYGTIDPDLTYQVTSGTLVASDEITGDLTRAVGEDCGTYEIEQGTLEANNYVITFVPAQLTVSAAPLTITADHIAKVYGQADPVFTHKITSGALVMDDLITGALTRASGENVDAYEIQQGTLSAGDNYNLTYIPADLTITPAPLTITANAKSKYVGSADPALTYQISGLVAADTSADTITGALARVHGEHVGTYQIMIGTLSAGANYNVVYTPANLVIKDTDRKSVV